MAVALCCRERAAQLLSCWPTCEEVFLQVCLLLVQLVQDREGLLEQLCAGCYTAQDQGQAIGSTPQCSMGTLHVPVHPTCSQACNGQGTSALNIIPEGLRALLL